jgi:hypothetical protein
MKLYGNGYGLNSFRAYENKGQLSIDIVPYDGDVVSAPENMEKGILYFKNNVFRTSLTLKVKVISTVDVKTLLTFELSSKSGFEGIKEIIDLALERE